MFSIAYKISESLCVYASCAYASSDSCDAFSSGNVCDACDVDDGSSCTDCCADLFLRSERRYHTLPTITVRSTHLNIHEEKRHRNGNTNPAAAKLYAS